jgi:hypothetical protein
MVVLYPGATDFSLTILPWLETNQKDYCTVLLAYSSSQSQTVKDHIHDVGDCLESSKVGQEQSKLCRQQSAVDTDEE